MSDNNSLRLRAIGSLLFGEEKIQAEMDRLRTQDDVEATKVLDQAAPLALAFVRARPPRFTESERGYNERIGEDLVTLAETELERLRREGSS